MKILEDAIQFTIIYKEVKRIILDDGIIPDIIQINNLTRKITERLMRMESDSKEPK